MNKILWVLVLVVLAMMGGVVFAQDEEGADVAPVVVAPPGGDGGETVPIVSDGVMAIFLQGLDRVALYVVVFVACALGLQGLQVAKYSIPSEMLNPLMEGVKALQVETIKWQKDAKDTETPLDDSLVTLASWGTDALLAELKKRQAPPVVKVE